MSTPTETAWQAPATKQNNKPVNSPKHKPSKPLTGKQKAFVQHLLENPTEPTYKAVQAAGYNAKDVNTASSIAVENLHKPAIMAELAKYSNDAEITLIEVMQQSKKEMMNTDRARAVDWANTARQAANDVMNRLHGMPTAKTEVKSTAVTLNIDLTGVTGEQ